ncbi:MAG: PKD domain-containing protein, partial [Bacteroidota bacterium]
SYTSLGNYDVTLIVSNAFGCIDSITKPAFVKIAKPVITIPSLPAAGCVPFTINPVATITSVDAIVSYLWDFGDGTTSTLQNPSHTYPSQGTYTVSLKIVTATGCTETLVINSAVKTGTVPTVDFTASPMILCVDETVQFTNNSSPATEWLWSFGDHSTSTEKSPSHLYFYSNDFDVSLTVSNNGCISVLMKPNFIRVNPPESYFEYFPNCGDRKHFTFIDRSDGALTWFWDFGDGTTSTDQNTTHDYAALGSYKVSLTTTNGSCTNIQSEIINVIDENPEVSAMPNPGCKESQVSLSAINIDPKNISSYFWDFGDASTSTVSYNGVNHTYNTSGNYTISLTTTDINGCTDNITKTNFLRINGPTANFSATNTSGCQRLTTTFNDLSSTDGINAITNWQWDFGDGSIQNFASGPFQHTYFNAGTYSVKLKVTDASGCSDTLTIPDLIITTDPVPDFSSMDSLTCPGATVTFNNSSVAVNYSSVWDFGDGTVSPNPTHAYANTGLYNVKLRITDQYGCADSITKSSFIRVDNPVAIFTLSDSISSCTPFEVNFKNASTYFTSILWNFGDGGISALPDSAVHYYGLSGSFPVSLIATSPGGCKDTAYKTINVYDTIGSYVHYTPLSGCSPIPVAFTAFTPGQVTYLWDFGDGNTQTTTNATNSHVFTSFGDYVPRVIMQDPSGCLVPVSGTETIHVTGSKSKFGSNTNLLCDSGNINFIDSTTFNDPITNWNWSFGDGTTSTEQNPVHSYSLPGIYTVSLNTLTTAGCRDTITHPDFVKVVLSPVIGITGDSIACIYNTMTQQGVFFRTDTSAVSWQWNFPNGNSSALQNPPTQTYNTAGNFAVAAIATNSSGCKDTATKNIFVNPQPTVDMPGTITILSGESILLPATYSPNVTTWQWTPQSGLSCSNCAQPVATPRVSTSYNVLFSDNNGCHNSQGINIVVACKDGNIFIPNTFSPNGDGSNDKFYPRGKGIDRIHVLRIFNRWGELVFEKLDFPVNDVSYGWDGTYKGKTPQAGVYIFQVEVYCSNGELIKFAGNVSLIL